MSEIHDAVRAWAKGLYATEAGVELLIRQGRTIYEKAPWVTELEPLGDDRPRMASIEPDVLLDKAGRLSGGELRVIRIAVSLLGGDPVDLSDAITGLDRSSIELVLAAIAHAAGSHEMATITQTTEGIPVISPPTGPLYPWPDVVPQQ